MTWVKLSDDFDERAVQLGLSDAAFRTHIEALLWTMRRETGGWIRTADIRRFAETRNPEAAVKELVSLGWWDYPAGDDRYERADPDRDPGADPDLFLIVANMDDQPEPDVIEARRRKTAERARRHRRKLAGLEGLAGAAGDGSRRFAVVGRVAGHLVPFSVTVPSLLMMPPPQPEPAERGGGEPPYDLLRSVA